MSDVAIVDLDVWERGACDCGAHGRGVSERGGIDSDVSDRSRCGCAGSERETVVRRIAELESELFGRGAWSENMVREELDAPARTYLLDVAAAEDPSTPALRASAQDDKTNAGLRASTQNDKGIACLRSAQDGSKDCRPARGSESIPFGHPEQSSEDDPLCHPERSLEGGAEGSPLIRGYAGYWYDGDDAELMTIGVARACQRQGVAAALLSELIARARAQGARRMLLEVRVDNEPALVLYQRFGFERMGLRKRYYQPGNIDAYTMSLDLNPRIVGFTAPDKPSETNDTSETREQGAEQ